MIYMRKGQVLYKQFQEKKYPVSSWAETGKPQWFALEPAYGNAYGSFQGKYKLKKAAKLLNIGDGRVREYIEQTIAPHDRSIHELSLPDEQYSGGMANLKYHNLV